MVTSSFSSGARAVRAPFHCRLMQPAEERLAADLDQVSFADLSIPLYNNVDARRVRTAAEARDGITTFVELGPGTVLSGLIRRIDRNAQRFSAHDRATLESVRATLTAR